MDDEQLTFLFRYAAPSVEIDPDTKEKLRERMLQQIINGRQKNEDTDSSNGDCSGDK